MADTAFERLIAMWQSGDINDDEFKLATKYLKEEQAKARIGNGNGTAHSQPGISARLLAMAVGPARVQQWSPYKRRFVEVGLSLVLGIAAITLAVQLYTWLIAAAWENDWDVSPIVAMVGTLVVVAVVGMFTGFNRRVVPIVAVPLFLLLLFSPMWGGDEHVIPHSTASANDAWYGQGVAVRQMWACRTEEAYTRSVSRAAEGRKREAEAEPGCMAFSPGQEAYVLPGGFMDGLKGLTRFEITGSTGQTYEFVTGKDAFRKK